MLVRSVWLGVVGLGLALSMQAAAMPPCVDRDGQAMAIDNDWVLHLKATSENQYQDRGFVSGVVVDIYEDRTGHEHFSISIGPGKGDTVEVIYNKKFGDMQPEFGMKVVACGDYITAHAPAGGYEASPDDAIIHWVHYNPKDKGHPHGYVILGDELVGYKPGWKASDL